MVKNSIQKVFSKCMEIFLTSLQYKHKKLFMVLFLQNQKKDHD